MVFAEVTTVHIANVQLNANICFQMYPTAHLLWHYALYLRTWQAVGDMDEK